MTNHLISIDWLQYYCHSTSGEIPDQGLVYVGKHKDSSGNYHNYTVKPTDKHSHVYLYNFEVVYRKCTVAFVGMTPRTPILNSKSVSVKLANSVLYRPDWAFYIEDVCSAFGFIPQSITRMDLCYDCKQFVDGYSPNQFIQDYVAASFNDQGHCYVRANSNKFFTVATRVALHEDATSPAVITGYDTRCEYLRWGTRESGTCVYLYNKSLELKESGKKQYIKEAWRKVGMDPDQGAPIYRLEISIKAKSMQVEQSDVPVSICGLEVRDIHELMLNDIDCQAKLEKVFHSYAQHYFRIHVNEGQRHVKDMPVKVLLEQPSEPVMHPRCLSKTWNIGTSERRAAATMRKFVRENPDLPTTWRRDFQAACDALDKIAEAKLGAHITVTASEIIQMEQDVFACDYTDQEHAMAWHMLVKQARATNTQRQEFARLIRGTMRGVHMQHNSGPLRVQAAASMIRKKSQTSPLWWGENGGNPTPWENVCRYPDFREVFATA